MTHLDSARLYLRGLEATKLRLTHWEGDVRSKPFLKIPPLNNEIMRVKLVIKDLTDVLVYHFYKGKAR